jgi:DNA end-binding protein Ku
MERANGHRAGSREDMPTTIAKMLISFGLVAVPVSVVAATEPRTSGLRQVHAADGSRVRNRRFCETEGVEVPWDQVARGFESGDGRVVVLTNEDLADLPLPTTKVIDVLGFVPSEDIDPLALDRSYYLTTTEPAASRPYVLLREALRESGLVAVAKMALRSASRESLAVLRVREDVLAVQTMLWPDEVRSTAGLAPDAPLPQPRELHMAHLLLEQLSEGFRWEDQHDAYKQALTEVIEARLAGLEPPHAPASQVMEGEVVDLMAVLEASVESARSARDSSSDSH